MSMLLMLDASKPYKQNEFGNLFTDMYLNYKCDLFGNVFTWSAKDGYDSYDFVKKVMTDKRLEKYFVYNDIQEWSDDSFLYHTIIKDIGKDIKKGKPIYDDYILWFAGYLYNYWMISQDMSCQAVYKICPFQLLVDNFEYLHCIDWDACIVFARENYVHTMCLNHRRLKTRKQT